MAEFERWRLAIILMVIFLTITVYSSCFLLKLYFHNDNLDTLEGKFEDENAEIKNDKKQESGNFVNIFTTPKITTNDRILLIDVQLCPTGAFDLLMFFNIPWKRNYLNIHSKIFQNFSENVVHVIEDFCDVKFQEEKSISVEVQSIEKLHPGIMINLKILTIKGNVSVEDLRFLWGHRDELYLGIMKRL